MTKAKYAEISRWESGQLPSLSNTLSLLILCVCDVVCVVCGVCGMERPSRLQN